RTSMGGTRLTKSDLLFSMVTASWKKINARREINDFVDRLNKKLSRENNLDKDFVLKAALFVTGASVRYKFESFTNESLGNIENQWQDIKTAIEETIKLVNSFGIDQTN